MPETDREGPVDVGSVPAGELTTKPKRMRMLGSRKLRERGNRNMAQEEMGEDSELFIRICIDEEETLP